MADGRFWAAYLDWYVRTEHRWDTALHIEAMSLQIIEFGRIIGEALMPALDKAAAAIRAFGRALREADPS